MRRAMVGMRVRELEKKSKEGGAEGKSDGDEIGGKKGAEDKGGREEVLTPMTLLSPLDEEGRMSTSTAVSREASPVPTLSPPH